MKNMWIKKMVQNYQNSCNKSYEKPNIKPSANCITKKPKRLRSAFSTEQITYLEREYKKFPYVGMIHRNEIAVALNIPERAVKIWFQNRRMKEKKELSNKEFYDEHIHQPMEFDKNRLNNVIAMQSANDQSLNSLQMRTTDVNIGKPMESHNIVNVNYQPLKDQTTSKYFHNTNQHKPGEKLMTFLKSRSLPKETKASMQSKTNTCHKSSDVNATRHLQSGSPMHPIPPISMVAAEDLSTKKPVQHPDQNRCISGYVPIIPTFYHQPFMSPGEVLWRPVNVLPFVPGAAHTLPNTNISSIQEHTPMPNTCSCDCHLKSTPTNMGHQNAPGPQYVLTALPSRKPSSF